MRSYRTTLSVCALACSLIAFPQLASALDVHNPHGATTTRAWIGYVAPWGQYIAWQNTTTGACSWHNLGPAGGLSDNTRVFGDAAVDLIHVASSTVSFCGYTFSPLVYNGHYLDIYGNGGNDFLSSGTGDTWIYGQGGDDWIWFSNPNGRLYGGTGNDQVMSDGTGGAESLYGESGNDCLRDANRVYNRVDCGSGYDAHGHFPADPGVISCEHYACCGLC
jgi:Ca2+-binding RTX toxin-like protein